MKTGPAGLPTSVLLFKRRLQNNDRNGYFGSNEALPWKAGNCCQMIASGRLHAPMKEHNLINTVHKNNTEKPHKRGGERDEAEGSILVISPRAPTVVSRLKNSLMRLGPEFASDWTFKAITQITGRRDIQMRHRILPANQISLKPLVQRDSDKIVVTRFQTAGFAFSLSPLDQTKC